ncbi:leucine-rich repeat-containing protein 9 [Clonorchis sinensis]|uniref:Leucine-rich repeat-containing protein 9 n=1 Tax=Clonorchis sinensis TaxID=79923 RepID=H2KNQ9_CLOSI|nr:leucine-rich repeat-containing protein 9 [Clonorchis sinensis]
MEFSEKNNPEERMPDSSPLECHRGLCLPNTSDLEDEKGAIHCVFHPTKKLQLLFSGFSSYISLAHFPFLSELMIMSQDLGKIANLQSCPNLKILWICECRVAKIENLDQCSNLEELYLYDNAIKKIENLENLKNLRVLWLNDNEICHIEGISELNRLESLNLSGNAIEYIKGEINHMRYLGHLCISGNRLSHLEDLLSLASLPKLVCLSVNEPGYMPNPVCSNPNFPLIVLYFLPRLKTLDQVNVGCHELREAIIAVMQIKQSYYRMQVQSKMALEERAANRLRTMYRKLSDKIYAQVEVLDKAARCLQAGIGPNPKSETTSECDRYLQIPWIKEIGQRIFVWESLLKKCRSELATELQVIQRKISLRLHLLQLELESCGYVEIEEAGPNDDWFAYCGNILATRCCARELFEVGIVGIKICRVYRIINKMSRHLSLQEPDYSSDEEKISSRECSNDQDAECGHSEVYFFVVRPQEDQELQQYASLISCNRYPNKVPITLTNCLNVADEANLTKLLVRRPDDTCPQPTFFATFLIVRTKNEPAFYNPMSKCKKDMCRGSVVNSTDLRWPAQSRRKEAKSCTCRSAIMNFKPNDENFLAASFVMEVKYIPGDQDTSLLQRAFGPTKPDSNDLLPNEELRADSSVLKSIPAKFLKPCNGDTLERISEKNSEQQIQAKTKVTSLSLLEVKLTRLVNLQRYSSLTVLSINHCRLRVLPALANLPLQSLDLSHNLLPTLTNLNSLPRLKVLNVNYNMLTNLFLDVITISNSCTKLQDLNLQFNPWKALTEVHLFVAAYLPSIKTVDGYLVPDNDRESAGNIFHQRRDTFCKFFNIRSTIAEEVVPSLTIYPTARLHLLRTELFNMKTTIVWKGIVSLCLNDCKLRTLEGFDLLTSLRYVCLDNNYLENLEGLKFCTHLEEISAEDNSLTSFEGFQQLKKLKRLLLGNNSIQSFSGLRKSDFRNLEVLVMRANGIKEVDGIAVMENLQELYVANNDLRELKVVLNLKDLLLLTIADFSGNPLTKKLNHYRLRMIFHLKSLKALDGQEISTNDTLRAKELLGGHLSEEFLMEKFNGENLSELVCLEMSGSLLKVVDVLSPEYFSKLQSVNLERNNLTSFGGLLFLPQLRTLCLNENNIETLFPPNIQLIASSSRRKLKDPADTHYVSLYTSKQAIFPKLKVLHLAKNHISTLLPLHFHRMPAIRSLFLQYNEISSFSGLEGLPLLRELVLDGNKIKEIPELSFQSRWSLQELHLESNRLRELYNLKGLENLKRVYLSGNKLYDLNDLERFSAIQKNLVEISLIDNPLTSRQIHRLILINGCLRVQVIDGIPVTSEERERCAAFYADIELQTLINTGSLPQPAPLCAQATRLTSTVCETTLPGINTAKLNLIPSKQSNAPAVYRSKPNFSLTNAGQNASGPEKIAVSLKANHKSPPCDLHIRGTNLDPFVLLNTNHSLQEHVLFSYTVPGISVFPAEKTDVIQPQDLISKISRPSSLPDFVIAKR